MRDFLEQIRRLSGELAEAYRNKEVDEFEQNAYFFLVASLKRIEEECSSDSLKPKSERYGEIARIVVEADPNLLDPDLGGRLIEAEKYYQSL